MVGRPPRRLGNRTAEAQPWKVQRLYESLYHMDRIVIAHPVIQALGQKGHLGPICASHETFHQIPPSIRENLI
jgi:hypothetical protein